MTVTDTKRPTEFSGSSRSAATCPSIGSASARCKSAMLPIPGTSSVAHLDDNCAAAAIELTDQEFEELSPAG